MTRPLERVEMQVVAGTELVNVKFGVENVYYFGYCWFTFRRAFDSGVVYGGKLQFVNHVDSVFFPEAKGAVGFQWQLFPGVSAIATAYELPAVENITVNGNVIDPNTQQLVNLSL